MAQKKKETQKPVKKPITGHIQKTPPSKKKDVGVSEAETLQKPEKSQDLSGSKSQDKKTLTKLSTITEDPGWWIIEDMAEWAKKLQRFEKMNPKKILFAAFIASPECCDLTNLQFCDRYVVHKWTLSEWRQQEETDVLRKWFLKWAMQRWTPKVLKQLRNAASSDDEDGKIQLWAVKTFLAYSEDFNEKLDLNLTNPGAITIQFANMVQSPFVQPPKESDKPEPVKKKSKPSKKKK